MIKFLFALSMFISLLFISCYEMPVFNNPYDQDSPQRYGSISGRIVDQNTNNAISGATVTTNPATSTATTDASGNYTIANVTPGTYTVNASKTGYSSNSTSVNVTGGSTSIANISLTLTTVSCPSSITDSRDGKVYETVLIDTHCWLKKNMNIGTRINGSQSPINNSTIEKYCYNDNENNCNTYGGLYTWNEAMQYVTTAGTKGICPAGWHIPILAEFHTLSSSVGGNSNSLKEVGQGSGSGAGTNTSGFSALLAGGRYYDGTFGSLGSYAYFWSSTEGSATYAYGMGLNYGNSGIDLGNDNKDYGFSVRCLKD